MNAPLRTPQYRHAVLGSRETGNPRQVMFLSPRKRICMSSPQQAIHHCVSAVFAFLAHNLPFPIAHTFYCKCGITAVAGGRSTLNLPREGEGISENFPSHVPSSLMAAPPKVMPSVTKTSPLSEVKNIASPSVRKTVLRKRGSYIGRPVRWGNKVMHPPNLCSAEM